MIPIYIYEHHQANYTNFMDSLKHIIFFYIHRILKGSLLYPRFKKWGYTVLNLFKDVSISGILKEDIIRE